MPSIFEILLSISYGFIVLWVTCRVYLHGLPSIVPDDIRRAAYRLNIHGIEHFIEWARTIAQVRVIYVTTDGGSESIGDTFHGHLQRIYEAMRRFDTIAAAHIDTHMSIEEGFRTELNAYETRINRRLGHLENQGLDNLSVHLELLWQRLEYLEAHDAVTYPNPLEGTPPHVRPSIPGVHDSIGHNLLGLDGNHVPIHMRSHHYRMRNDVLRDVARYRSLSARTDAQVSEDLIRAGIPMRDQPPRPSTPYPPPPAYSHASVSSAGDNEELTEHSIVSSPTPSTPPLLIPAPDPPILQVTVPDIDNITWSNEIYRSVADLIHLPNAPSVASDDDLYA